MRSTAAAAALVLAGASGACSVDYDRHLGTGGTDLGARQDAAGDLGARDAADEAEPRDAAPRDGAPPHDAGDLGAPDAGACMSRRPPPRPGVADRASMSPRYFAMRTVRVGSEGAWRELGYDLDGLCTMAGTDPSELGCMPLEPLFPAPADAPDGIDNTYGQSFVPLIELVFPRFEEDLTAALETGVVGILLRVAEWNGSDDDPVVDVALIDGVRLEGAVDAGALAPRWDGRDRWLAADRAFAAGDLDRPLARDSAAYVTGGQLVARPRDGTELHLPAGVSNDLVIRFQGLFVTARITAFGAELEDGIIAGSWALDDGIAALPGLGNCPGTELYEPTVSALRRASDIRVGSVDPTLPCDAVSVGFGFSAQPVELAGLTEGLPFINRCRRDAGP